MAREALLLSYCNDVCDCSVQCANGTGRAVHDNQQELLSVTDCTVLNDHQVKLCLSCTCQ